MPVVDKDFPTSFMLCSCFWDCRDKVRYLASNVGELRFVLCIEVRYLGSLGLGCRSALLYAWTIITRNTWKPSPGSALQRSTSRDDGLTDVICLAEELSEADKWIIRETKRPSKKVLRILNFFSIGMIYLLCLTLPEQMRTAAIMLAADFPSPAWCFPRTTLPR